MMKYIILHHPVAGERPYIFHKDEKHQAIADLLCSHPDWRAVRGGFVRLSLGAPGSPIGPSIRCWGGAYSLNLSSDEEKDTALLTRLLSEP